MKNIIVFLSVSLLLFSSCTSDDKSKAIVSCGQNAFVLAEEQYDAVETDYYISTNVTLSGNCLSVTIGASGCDPNNWTLNLFSTDAFFDVFPLQRTAKIQLVMNELCAAAFVKTVVFDLTPYQISGPNSVSINLESGDEPINYQY
ncbi:hypothetical protein [Flavobacterium sp. SM2513]|uniref:hypothetical protein n=1 Tax=Flavobacterium sp. SM2513 TaxID=3424766 RepID=UPI003D7F45B0